MAGPLTGIRMLELASIGPGPFAGMLLADAGAEVVRIERPGAQPDAFDPMLRGRRSIVVDLKHDDGAAVVRRLASTADGLFEGMRPGVAERLGVGPAECLAANPALVYGRVTGWGQDGPWAHRAGHDIDYVSLSGALHPIGTPDAPPPVPLNYVGDFGGGGMMLAFGLCAALLHARATGVGQVVDAAMVDGAALQTVMLHGMRAAGRWSDQRGCNLLDGAAPFYTTYETADGGYMAVGALEPHFYAELLARLDLDEDRWPQHDRRQWPEQRARLSGIFASRTRAAWVEHFADSDACVAPVLAPGETAAHAHLAARGTVVERDGVLQPAPAPRHSHTVSELPHRPPQPGADTDAVLTAAGFDPAEVAALRASAAVA